MNTAFRQVLQIDIQHNFYKEKKCTDFDVCAVNDTLKLLRNRQAIFSFKQSFGKLLILEDTSGTTAAHPIDTNDVLVFTMELLNPALANITIEWPAPKKIFLFTNVGNLMDPATCDPASDLYVDLLQSEISLSGKVLTHRIVSNSALTLELINETGLTVESLSFDAGSANLEQAFDLQQHSNGLFTVRETVGMVSTDYLYYADDVLLFKNIFALIRIVNQSAFPFNYDGKPFYRIRFTPKSSAWKYYVVAPNMSGADIATLNIEDVGRSGMSKIIFNTTPITGLDKTAPMLAKDPGKVVLFTSASSLLYQQIPLQQIELRKGAMTLIGNLPNPDVRKPTTEMFIYV
jgi:hypothetical protein